MFLNIFQLTRYQIRYPDRLVILSNVLLFCFLFSTLPPQISGSRGDRSHIFQTCIQDCHEVNCTSNGEFIHQPFHLAFLGWDCVEECNYQCMWSTIAKFESRQESVPQFFGKWPFIRIFGIQEPASVIASVLNLVAHLYGLYKLRSRAPHDAPLFIFWHWFCIVCVNGWIWSTIFHTKDTQFTELLDYFCAFSMVVFSFFAAFVRLYGKVSRIEVSSIGAIIAVLYAYHVHYLTKGRFDYGYNMKANITIGVLNAAIWLTWSGRNRHTHPHVWKCALSVLLAVASIILEVNDFSPILWTVDAHALWHFSTAAISPLWYRRLSISGIAGEKDSLTQIPIRNVNVQNPRSVPETISRLTMEDLAFKTSIGRDILT